MTFFIEWFDNILNEKNERREEKEIEEVEERSVKVEGREEKRSERNACMRENCEEGETENERGKAKQIDKEQ